MHLEISAEDRRLLLELLESRLEELQPEIRRCRNYHYQDQLKEEHDCVKRLYGQLQGSESELPTSTQGV